MKKALFILGPKAYELIYGEEHHKNLSQLVDLNPEPQTSQSVRQNPACLEQAEIIFSGWGGPVMDQEFLDLAPRLKMVLYGAGSIRRCTGDSFWNRGIRITSAYAANAVPVSEYTLASILFSLKRGWYFAREIKANHAYPPKQDPPGAYNSTVGLLSLGMVGKLVRERLRPFDLNVLACDPFIDEETADWMDLEPVDMKALFERSDVVSVHTPLLNETRNMIRGEHFASMKHNATFINTSRGAVVQQDEMIEVLRQRPDLQAVLDVTYPEPPAPGSPLFTLPNVTLTPHIAGSAGPECRRMGRYMVDELKRYLNDEPLKWEITRERAAVLA